MDREPITVCPDCKGVNVSPDELGLLLMASRRLALCATCRKPIDPYARIPREILNPRRPE